VKYFHEDGLSGEEREVPHPAAGKGTGCKAQGCSRKDAAERSGMKRSKFKLHRLRDSFATWHLRAGRDIRTVQHWLGHSSIEMTQKYLAPQKGEAAQSQMNDILMAFPLERMGSGWVGRMSTVHPQARPDATAGTDSLVSPLLNRHSSEIPRLAK
jgi:hypothetical protein